MLGINFMAVDPYLDESKRCLQGFSIRVGGGAGFSGEKPTLGFHLSKRGTVYSVGLPWLGTS